MGFLSNLFGGGPKKSADYDPALGGHITGQFGDTGLLGDARAQYGYGPPRYDPNYRIEDFTGAEIAGQKALTQYGTSVLPGMYGQGMASLTDLMRGGGANPTFNQAMGAFGNLAGGQGNPYLQQAASGELSPHMQGVMTGAMNDLSRNYTNTTNNIMDQFQVALGSADDSAMLAGQFGGSRGGVAQGIVGKEATRQTGMANQALSENMSQATADILNQQFMGARDAQLRAGQSIMQGQLGAAQGMADLYGTDMRTRLSATGMLPMMGEFGAMGGRLLGEVGGAQRALEQAKLDEAKNRWDFNQNAPWANMGRYADLIAKLGPFMSRGAPQGGGSPLAGALGGAVSGFGLTKRPWGAAAGGIAGLLS